MNYRKLRMAIASCGMAIVALAGSAQPANAATAPRPDVRTFECTATGVVKYHPEMYASNGGDESVYHSPDLYIYYGNAWHLWDSSKPWYRGIANAYNTRPSFPYSGAKWANPDGTQASSPVRFDNLPRGYWYAVVEYFRYQSGNTYPAQWALTSTNSQSCRVG